MAEKPQERHRVHPDSRQARNVSSDSNIQFLMNVDAVCDKAFQRMANQLLSPRGGVYCYTGEPSAGNARAFAMHRNLRPRNRHVRRAATQVGQDLAASE